jgi:hypothetical protein
MRQDKDRRKGSRTGVAVCVTWTNDPNNLQKQRFVKGQIGINYDFGLLKNLLDGGR